MMESFIDLSELNKTVMALYIASRVCQSYRPKNGIEPLSE